jgi:hypothetical protein
VLAVEVSEGDGPTTPTTFAELGLTVWVVKA